MNLKQVSIRNEILIRCDRSVLNSISYKHEMNRIHVNYAKCRTFKTAQETTVVVRRTQKFLFLSILFTLSFENEKYVS